MHQHEATPGVQIVALLVNEIFYSIQGESITAGCPCIFIRLAGCNLRCTYCDTRYAYDDGAEVNLADIIDKIIEYRCRLVAITGGEPLFQAQTPRLISALIENGYDVMMETNGSYDIRKVDPRCMKIVDIKCPSSEMSEKNDLENINRLNERDQLKFVMGSRQDYEFAKKILPSIPSGISRCNVLFSPVHGVMPPDRLAKWILEDQLNVRLNLQLHKVIWPLEQRGV